MSRVGPDNVFQASRGEQKLVGFRLDCPKIFSSKKRHFFWKALRQRSKKRIFVWKRCVCFLPRLWTPPLDERQGVVAPQKKGSASRLPGSQMFGKTISRRFGEKIVEWKRRKAKARIRPSASLVQQEAAVPMAVEGRPHFALPPFLDFERYFYDNRAFASALLKYIGKSVPSLPRELDGVVGVLPRHEGSDLQPARKIFLNQGRLYFGHTNH